MEIPGDYTDKLNIIYTYSVKFEVSIPCHNLTFSSKSSIYLSYEMKIKSLSRVRLFATRWTVAYQACIKFLEVGL